SGYPDEPGHLITGVLVKNYVTTFPLQSPVAFAKEFYIHRPKIAIGHWPPVLYFVEAIWFILFHVSRSSALALMAFICASLAASICHVVRRRHGTAAGIAAGLLFVGLSFVQTQTSRIMADMLVAFFGFWAVLAFAAFLETRRAWDILCFAAFSLLAIFTKNNGLYLVFTPLLSMAMAKKLGMLRDIRLWLGAAIVGIPSVAWVLWSRSLVENTWASKPGLNFFLRASGKDLVFIYTILGPCLLLFAAAGVVRDLINSRATGDLVPLTLIAAALSVLVFQSLAPAGIEPRFLAPAIAALIPVAFSGILWLGERLRTRAISAKAWAVVLLALGLAISPSRTFAIPHKPYRGFSELADFITSQPRLRQGVTIVSSGSDGEGLLISEIVMRYPISEGYVLRASKVLAQMDWLGRFYKPRFESADEVFKYLTGVGVDLVVIEDQPNVPVPQHQRLLLEMCQEHADVWQRVGVFPARVPPVLQGSSILVYRRIGNVPPRIDALHRDMERILDRKLGD
ncbi:MAG: ArnT family glycosyltransferase, partial [Bryobacteraceae bacterium]